MTLDIHEDLKKLVADIEEYKRNSKDDEDILESVYKDFQYIMMCEGDI